MSTSAILGMTIILSIVVGGFIFFLSMAIRKEGKNKHILTAKYTRKKR